jgi:chemotaxis protein MotA
MSENSEASKKSAIDLATIVGLVVAFCAILGGQALEGGSVGSIMQGTAALIVLGGTFGPVWSSSRFQPHWRVSRLSAKYFRNPKPTARALSRKLFGWRIKHAKKV